MNYYLLFLLFLLFPLAVEGTIISDSNSSFSGFVYRDTLPVYDKELVTKGYVDNITGNNSGNPFDQSLNTPDNVTFGKMTLSPNGGSITTMTLYNNIISSVFYSNIIIGDNLWIGEDYGIRINGTTIYDWNEIGGSTPAWNHNDYFDQPCYNSTCIVSFNTVNSIINSSDINYNINKTITPFAFSNSGKKWNLNFVGNPFVYGSQYGLTINTDYSDVTGTMASGSGTLYISGNHGTNNNVGATTFIKSVIKSSGGDFSNWNNVPRGIFADTTNTYAGDTVGIAFYTFVNNATVGNHVSAGSYNMGACGSIGNPPCYELGSYSASNKALGGTITNKTWSSLNIGHIGIMKGNLYMSDELSSADKEPKDIVEGTNSWYPNFTTSGNLIVDNNIYVGGCIKYNCKSGTCTTLGTCS